MSLVSIYTGIYFKKAINSPTFNVPQNKLLISDVRSMHPPKYVQIATVLISTAHNRLTKGV